jgi:hypothetical protein
MRLSQIAHSSTTTTNPQACFSAAFTVRSNRQQLAAELVHVGALDGEKPAALGKSKGLVLSTVATQNFRQSRI